MYTLHNEDCLKLIPTLSTESIDAVITDPPYGIDYQSARRIDRTQWKPKITNDREPFLEWLPEAYRVTKDGGCLVCFCRWDVEERFRQAIMDAGFAIRSQVIWDKVIHGMGDLNGAFAPQHENLWFATKGNFVFWGRRPVSVIRHPRVPAENMIHPNEKPAGLFIKIIEALVPAGGVVLDCFMGSGNSGIASCQTSRNYIGIEIVEHYYQLARKRISAACSQPGLFAIPAGRSVVGPKLPGME